MQQGAGPNGTRSLWPIQPRKTRAGPPQHQPLKTLPKVLEQPLTHSNVVLRNQRPMQRLRFQKLHDYSQGFALAAGHRPDKKGPKRDYIQTSRCRPLLMPWCTVRTCLMHCANLVQMPGLLTPEVPFGRRPMNNFRKGWGVEALKLTSDKSYRHDAPCTRANEDLELSRTISAP